MKRTLLLVGLLFMALSGGLTAQGVMQPAKPQQKISVNKLNEPIPVDKKVRIGKLDNGLTYIIRKNDKPENYMEFGLAIKAGSILEDESQVGLAHFLEHMAFNGTKYYPGNQMIDLLEKKGIVFGREINAYTSFDQTVYTVTLPKNDAEYTQIGFNVLDGWANALLLDGKEIDKERGVIIEEWRGRLGVQERLRVATWPALLNGARYTNRLPIGTEENLRTFKHETIRNFYKTWYRPDLMAVILVGDFDPDVMEAKVKEVFGAIPKRDNQSERPYYGIPDNEEPLIKVAVDKEATSTSLNFFWKHPNPKTITWNDFKENNLLSALYSGMMNSRLAELADNKNNPYTRASISYGGFYSPLSSVFYVAATPKDNKIDTTVNLLFTELMRVKQHGFLESEFERQKESILSVYEKMANEESKRESSSFNSEYVDYFIDGEPIPDAKLTLKYVKDILESTTLAEVNALTDRYISPNNFVFILTGPDKKELSYPTEKSILEMYKKMPSIQTEPWVDLYVEEPLITEDLKAARIVSRKEDKKSNITEVTLANGVKVIMKPTTFKNDQILMSSFSPGGSSIYSEDKLVSATYAAKIVDQSGIGTMNNTQLMKKLKGKMVNCGPDISELSESINGSSSPKDLEYLFQLTYLYFKEPRKDQETFDKVTTNLKNQVRFLDANPKVTFFKKIKSATYPQDTRTMIAPTEADVDKMTLDEVYEIYTDRFADASDFSFFFVGNFDVDSMMILVQKYLGNLPSTNRKENWVNRSTPFATGIVNEVVNQGEDKQGILYIQKDSPYTWGDKENMVMSVLSSCAGITLREVIREKLGGTYSPYLQLQPSKLPEQKLSLVVYIECDPTNAEKIKKESIKIIDKYAKKGADKETLAKVKEQMISSYKKEFNEENGFWLGSMIQKYVFGENIIEVADYEKMVNEITNEDLIQAAKQYLTMKSYVSVVLKPEVKK